MKFSIIFLCLFLSLETTADIYDDFVENHIIKEARENLIERYRSEEVPEGFDSKEWAESTEKVIQKVETDLGEGGQMFSIVAAAYRENFTTEDMILLLDLVSNPAYQELMKKNNVVKSNVSDALQDYIFEELIDEANEIRWQE